MRHLRLYLLLLLSLSVSLVAADSAYLVKDIRLAPSTTAQSSTPVCFTDHLGLAVFRADGEIWRSDGTDAGTLKLSNTDGFGPSCPVVSGGKIFFGAGDPITRVTNLWVSDGTVAGTIKLLQSTPLNLTDVNGVLFFTAADANGTELWKSDGTAVGTLLVKDIEPGSGSSSPQNLIAVNGTLFFSANATGSGRELWTSDGTAGGTNLVLDINLSGAIGFTGSEMVAIGGTVYFAANDGLTGKELWKSNGQSSGTVKVAEINSFGAGSATPRKLTVVGNLVYFVADQNTDTALFASDGSAAGTTRLSDVVVASVGFNNRVAFNGQFLFQGLDPLNGAGTELWISNGTPSGTRLFMDIRPGSQASSPNNMAVFNGVLYFGANDGVNGRELWKTNLQPGGTVLVEDIVPGVGSSDPQQLAVIDGQLFMNFLDPAVGRELALFVDPTTSIVKNLNLEPGGSAPTDLITLGDLVYFAAEDDDHGRELWRSDGTEQGTFLLQDVNLGASDGDPRVLGAVGNRVVFVAKDDAIGIGLFSTDGTAAGTVLITTIGPGNGIASASIVFDGAIYFDATETTTGSELWKTDGTTAGTVRVKDIWFSWPGSRPRNFSIVADQLYFFAEDNAGVGLWITDGTESGTLPIATIAPGTPVPEKPLIVDANGSGYFVGDDPATGREPWVTDGTPSGTMLLDDINPGAADSMFPFEISNVAGTAILFATEPISGLEPWGSNGTSATTGILRDIHRGPSGSFPMNATRLGSYILFGATDDTFGGELWRTDGTFSGTELVKDIYLGSTSGIIGIVGGGPMAQVNGEVFFSASDASNGFELWKSDGTELGTVLVKDINLASSSSPRDFFAAPPTGVVYFAAETANLGFELWKTDGTPAGTVFVQEIATGPKSGLANPSWALSGSRVFFVADDDVNGEELWAVTLEEPGTLPDGSSIFPGTPLTVERGSGDEVILNWASATCGGSAIDYAVYEGPIGDFSAHVRRNCSTGGATSTAFLPESSSRYFLVVPQGSAFEGSYGRDASGTERSVAADACLPRAVFESCP